MDARINKDVSITINDIRNALISYEENKGNFRKAAAYLYLPSESQQDIRRLKELNEKISDQIFNRPLNQEELFELVDIIIHNNTIQNSESAKVFLKLEEKIPAFMQLARQLGKQVLQNEFSIIYAQFSKAKLLHDYIVFLKNEQISIEKHAHVICQHLTHDPLLFGLIYRFRSIHFWTDEVIAELLKVAAHAKFLYDMLSVISKDQIQDKEMIPKLFSWIPELIVIQDLLSGTGLNMTDYASHLLADDLMPKALLQLLQTLASHPHLITADRLNKLLMQGSVQLDLITRDIERRQQEAGGYMFPNSWEIYLDGLLERIVQTQEVLPVGDDVVIQMPVTSSPQLIAKSEMAMKNHTWTSGLFSPPSVFTFSQEEAPSNSPKVIPELRHRHRSEY